MSSINRKSLGDIFSSINHATMSSGMVLLISVSYCIQYSISFPPFFSRSSLSCCRLIPNVLVRLVCSKCLKMSEEVISLMHSSANRNKPTLTNCSILGVLFNASKYSSKTKVALERKYSSSPVFNNSFLVREGIVLPYTLPTYERFG